MNSVLSTSFSTLPILVNRFPVCFLRLPKNASPTATCLCCPCFIGIIDHMSTLIYDQVKWGLDSAPSRTRPWKRMYFERNVQGLP